MHFVLDPQTRINIPSKIIQELMNHNIIIYYTSKIKKNEGKTDVIIT